MSQPLAWRFRLAGIPVAVRPLFLVTGVAIWAMAENAHWALLPIDILIVFQGVLLHELGHAFAGRALGLEPEIELGLFHGATRWRTGFDITPGQEFFVSIAGPAVGILVGSVALFFYAAGGDIGGEGAVNHILFALVLVNLGWSVLNLLPIWPLDGGQAMAALFRMVSKESGLRVAHYVSLIVAVAVVAGTYRFMPVLAVFSGLFAYQNYRALQIDKRMRAEGLRPLRSLREVLDFGVEALSKPDVPRAIQAAIVVLRNVEAGRAPEEQEATLRDEAHHLLAWGHLMAGDMGKARGALDALRERRADPALEGAIELGLGRVAPALTLLEEALEHAPGPFVEAQWVQGIQLIDGYDRARGFLQEGPDRVSQSARQDLAEAAAAAGDEAAPELAALAGA